MTASRPVTPAGTRPVTPPASRPAVSSSPWALTEFTAPPPLPPRGSGGHASHYSPAEVAQLREEMQAQQVRAVADARRAAFDEGRAAGRADARESADARVRDAVDALHAAIADVKQHEEAYLGVLEENLTALACAVARQVIQREVQLEPSAIRGLVHAALAEFPQEAQLRVRLNPQDHQILSSDTAFRDLVWVADSRIVRGGCVVEGRERIVDGRVDLALEQIFRVLTGLDA